jgi:hypothetical protein
VIVGTHHLLDNKWRSALDTKVEAMGTKVESMDLKMESMSNSLVHIKELLLKNVDNGSKGLPLPMQEVPYIGLDVIEDLVHSRVDLKVDLKDMACIFVLGLITFEQTPPSLKLDMGLKESKAKEDGVQPSEGLLNIPNLDCVLECNKVMDIIDVEVVASMNMHDDEGHKSTNELRGNGGHDGEQVSE